MASKRQKDLAAAGAAQTMKFISAHVEEPEEQEKKTFVIQREEKPEEPPKTFTIAREEKPQEPPKKLYVGKSTSAEEKPVKTANTKPQKQVFSFRAEKELVKQWRTYAAACPGMKVDELGRLALQEYIENHPLTGAAKKFYQEAMKEG